MSHRASDPTEPSDADAVRAEIEATRADLAQTVDALHAKLDVKRRAGDKAAEVKQGVTDYAARAKAAAPPPVQQALDRAGSTAAPVARRVAQQAAPHRREIVIGAVTAAVAFVLVRRRRDGRA